MNKIKLSKNNLRKGLIVFDDILNKKGEIIHFDDNTIKVQFYKFRKTDEIKSYSIIENSLYYFEYIACSAIYYNDGIERVHLPRNLDVGIVACGLRHNNCYLILRELYPKYDYKSNQVEGFLTSFNRFVDRKEAIYIAYSMKQINKIKKELHSEDVY